MFIVSHMAEAEYAQTPWNESSGYDIPQLKSCRSAPVEHEQGCKIATISATKITENRSADDFPQKIANIRGPRRFRDKFAAPSKSNVNSKTES